MLVHDIIALIYYVSVAPIQTAGTGDFVGLHLSGDTTPNTARRSMFSRAVNTLRHSGGKGGNCTRSSSHALYVLAYVPASCDKHSPFRKKTSVHYSYFICYYISRVERDTIVTEALLHTELQQFSICPSNIFLSIFSRKEISSHSIKLDTLAA